MTRAQLLVVGALLIRGSELLLGLRARDRSYSPGVWDAIGGHVEEGEGSEAALERELAEEVGIVPITFSVIGDFSQPGVDACRLYRVDEWLGEPRLCNNEHEALRWFSVKDACLLKNLASDHYREIFRSLDLPSISAQG